MSVIPDAAVAAAGRAYRATVFRPRGEPPATYEQLFVAILTAALPHLVADRDAEIAAWEASSGEQIRHYNGLLNARKAEIAAKDKEMARLREALERIADPNERLVQDPALHALKLAENLDYAIGYAFAREIAALAARKALGAAP